MAHEVIWRLADRAAVQREIEIACAGAARSKEAAAIWFEYFMKQLQLHPMEWPSSPGPPSEHTFRLGGLSVRYRLIPDAQTVEILSVTGKHLGSDEPGA